jgi:cysteine desulfurase/selenocysteine lyase
LFDYQIDVKNIVKHARKINKNIIVIVDATQSVPHTKFDARNNDVDFFVCSAHKMCGPSGIGIMYGKYKHLIKMEPNTYGGGMVSTVENNGKINLAPPPERFEAGTPNTEAILGFGAAIDFLKKIGMNNINNHEIELKKYIDQQFKHIKNIEYVTKDNIYPIVSFNIKGVNPQDLANYLGTNKIIVRGGMACVKMQGMFSNNPNGYVRASFYLYNDKKDVDRLVTVLKNFDQKKQFKNIL